jgi:hypothetical protein
LTSIISTGDFLSTARVGPAERNPDYGCILGAISQHYFAGRNPADKRLHQGRPPFPGAAAPAINVGHPVEGAMIPLPSPLVEKLPKLRGAKFTTRNGSIIIVRTDSRSG